MPDWMSAMLFCRGFAPAAGGGWTPTCGDRLVDVAATAAGHVWVRGVSSGADPSVWGHRLDAGFTPGMARSVLAAALDWAGRPEPAAVG